MDSAEQPAILTRHVALRAGTKKKRHRARQRPTSSAFSGIAHSNAGLCRTEFNRPRASAWRRRSRRACPAAICWSSAAAGPDRPDARPVTNTNAAPQHGAIIPAGGRNLAQIASRRLGRHCASRAPVGLAGSALGPAPVLLEYRNDAPLAAFRAAQRRGRRPHRRRLSEDPRTVLPGRLSRDNQPEERPRLSRYSRPPVSSRRAHLPRPTGLSNHPSLRRSATPI